MLAGQQVAAGFGYSTCLPDFDFETFSAAGYRFDEQVRKWKSILKKGKGGLSAVGAAVYSEHPSTEILCLAWDLKDGLGARLWRPGMPDPLELFNHIKSGGLLEAVNSPFEFYIWKNVCAARMGWPELPFWQTRDAAAKFRAFSIPGGLEKAGKALNAPIQKDTEGTRLLNLFSKPHNPVKDFPARRRKFVHEYPADAALLYAYNVRDIEAEHSISMMCPDLTPDELEVWQLDQFINTNGVAIDVETLGHCEAIIEQAGVKYLAELREITGGAVQTEAEIANMSDWLASRGCGVPNLQKETVEFMLDDDARGYPIPPDARRVLEIRQVLGSASVKKVAAIRIKLCKDNRLRDIFMYAGADRTARWAGRGPQPQNLPSGGPPADRCGCGRHYGAHLAECPWCGDLLGGEPVEWGIDAATDAMEILATRDLATVEQFFGDPIKTVSGCLRGLFVAAPGHDLICSDYSAIEAVVLACMAGEQWRIDVFNGHGKIYEMSASKITGTPFEEMMEHKRKTGEHHPLRKKIGKVAELASGYGGGLGAWKQFGADKFMNDEEIEAAKKAWRAESPAIPAFWYGLEDCARAAIQVPGSVHEFRGLTFYMRGDALFVKLLSGRHLVYHSPRLHEDVTPWGKPVLKITYMGNNSDPKKGSKGWMRLDTYGGKLCENCISEGTDVLTDSGWKKIECVTRLDKVHDGVSFVTHGGLLHKSTQTCIPIDGVWMTPDHEVLTNEGWETASQHPRPYRPSIRSTHSNSQVTLERQKMAVGLLLRVWERSDESRRGGYERAQAGRDPELRVPYKGAPVEAENARNGEAPGLRSLPLHGRPLPPTLSSSLEELRGTWNHCMRAVGEELRAVLGRCENRVQTRSHSRPGRQQWELRTGERSLGTLEGASEKQAEQPDNSNAYRANDSSGGVRSVLCERNDDTLPHKTKMAGRQNVYPTASRESRVFDIVNAGPLQRFVVKGEQGPFIVHNCVQATARDILAFAMVNLQKAGYPVVLHVHDEAAAEVPHGVGTVEEFERIMQIIPAWCQDWPIRAAGGWRGKRYRKD